MTWLKATVIIDLDDDLDRAVDLGLVRRAGEVSGRWKSLGQAALGFVLFITIGVLAEVGVSISVYVTRVSVVTAIEAPEGNKER